MTPQAEDARPRLLDVNVLVAMSLTTHVHHRAAHRALASFRGSWATCPLTESGTLRLLLNPRVAGTHFTARQVIDIIGGMHRHPGWRFLRDDVTPAEPLINFSVLTSHQYVTDLHLVDLAARNGAALATFDSRLPPVLDPDDRRHVELLPT